jgi:hypothetical protein
MAEWARAMSCVGGSLCLFCDRRGAEAGGLGLRRGVPPGWLAGFGITINQPWHGLLLTSAWRASGRWRLSAGRGGDTVGPMLARAMIWVQSCGMSVQSGYDSLHNRVTFGLGGIALAVGVPPQLWCAARRNTSRPDGGLSKLPTASRLMLLAHHLVHLCKQFPVFHAQGILSE